MNILESEFKDVKIIENFDVNDVRGSFIKIFNEGEFNKLNLGTDYKEAYYSISKKDVIRGMHFQLPPYDHIKLVHVIKGEIIDVILDLRKNSHTYRKCMAIHLSGNKPKSIYIPKGFAHGFKSLKDNTIMLYNVTSSYNKEHDCGIKWDSIDYDWNVEEPIISCRDTSFLALNEFDSPF